MARKIRYPLEMKNGASVRTIEDLQNNFDIDSVLGYFLDGKLETWLRDRYYDEKAEAISQLSHDDEELASKICEIIGVKWKSDSESVDLEIIQRRKEKLDIIRGFTCDREIIDNIDYVALNQDDLFDILDMSPKNVWLYGEKFSIPIGKKNVLYIGLNDPLVILERDKYVGDYVKADISFKDVSFEKYIDPEQRYIEGRWKEAFPELLSMAENGNPRAMYIVASSYQEGCGVYIDASKCREWLVKAYGYNEPISTMNYAYQCCEDNEERQKNILKMFSEPLKKLAETGDILAKYEYANYLKCYTEDKVRAFQIMKECADCGFIQAQYQLGDYYNIGEGVEEDNVKAVEWFRKAAEHGYIPAQNSLGVCYDTGKGVEKDYVKAVEWYRKAADQGWYFGQHNLGLCYYYGTGVEEDNVKAVEWFRKAADQGYDSARDMLGVCYANGYGVEKDDVKAVEWYRKAAEHGCDSAQNRLGLCYYNGDGVEEDNVKAVEWFRKAADQGYDSAQDMLGVCYARGDGVEQDNVKAVEWYRKAAEHGCDSAQNKLGVCYSCGRGVEKDDVKAAEWFRKAADQGNYWAQYNLGGLYADGRGVEKDDVKAVEWYQKAARQGHKEAQNELSKMGKTW